MGGGGGLLGYEKVSLLKIFHFLSNDITFYYLKKTVIFGSVLFYMLPRQCLRIGNREQGSTLLCFNCFIQND